MRTPLARDVKPLSEFRANVSNLVQRLRKTKRPLVLTRRGRCAAVVLDVSQYEELLEEIETLRDVRVAERELAQGKGLSHLKAFARVTAAAPVRIEWSPIAVQRAIEAARYIAADNPQAARAWVDALFSTVERLARFPQSGRVVPELGRRRVREILFGAYRVIYRVERSRLLVLTVRHGRRLLDPSELA